MVTNQFKKLIQNIAIILLILIGIKNLFAALPFKFTKDFVNLYTNMINPNEEAIHHVLSFLLGVLMLLLAYRLYKRIRTAWIIEVISISFTLVIQIYRYRTVTLPIILIEIFVLLVLALSYKDFCRKADNITFKKAFIVIAVSFFLVLLNACFGLFMMRESIRNINDIFDAFISSVQLLILMNKNGLVITGRFADIYADSLIAINWICILASLLLLSKPLILDQISSKHDKDRVRQLVMSCGQNPMAYMSLENDKKYFFGSEADGVCSYRIVSGVFVVCGDMICDKKDGFVFLNEIIDFCRQNGYEIGFVNITDYFLELYKMAGFGVIKYGEDACFNLNEYNLAGGKIAKVRAAINHAKNIGLEVKEYKPLEERDENAERQITEISQQWLENKGGDEMGFMFSSIGFEDPLDKRYFYSIDKDGTIQGFVVFIPYLSGKGYLADITRRRKDAPQGALERTIYEAFMKMKDEGALWGNLGLSPLYNVADSDKTSITEKLFNYLYENISDSYDFKTLHHAKLKFAPTDWQPRYLAYSPRPFSPNLAYAMVRAQVGKGLTKMVKTELKQKKGRQCSCR